MPKISVHLEADSAEEFRALLSALYATVPMTGVTSRRVTPDEKPLIKVPPVEDFAPPKPEEQQEPEVSQGPSEAEQPAAEAKEPAQPRRGRPRKEKPAETPAEPAEAAAVEPAPEAPAVADPAAVKVKAEKAKEQAKNPEIVVSRQDLLDAFSEYVQRYGASFGFSDISSLLQKNLGDGVRKASDVPEEKLPVAIDAIKTAIADNPFNRKRDYA
jgi:hypothetical protein